LGGVKDIRVDVRVIAATNRDLEEMASTGTFREDLLYRINVVTIVIPPLRERREDIPLLAHFFADKASPPKSKKSMTADAMELLTGYDWPGNVRELQHVMERAVVLCQDNLIDAGDLPSNVRLNPKAFWKSRGSSYPTLDELERKYILTLLKEFGGNRHQVADALHLSERTLYRKLRQFRLN
jgi:DNA-binding NtrC family response regulator